MQLNFRMDSINNTSALIFSVGGGCHYVLHSMCSRAAGRELQNQTAHQKSLLARVNGT